MTPAHQIDGGRPQFDSARTNDTPPELRSVRD
jgi:hypothetical protein